jgi:hypothetical protein
MKTVCCFPFELLCSQQTCSQLIKRVSFPFETAYIMALHFVQDVEVNFSASDDNTAALAIEPKAGVSFIRKTAIDRNP